MSRKIPYKDIIDRIKDDVDYIADEAYKNGYDDGAKSVKNWDEEEKNLRIKEAYEKGLDDVWECIKKIQDTPEKVRVEIFGNWAMPNIVRKHTASEAMAKIKAYEDEHKIRVGDEVKAWYGNAIVTHVDEKAKTANFFYITGDSGCDYLKNIERTGRHFDEIEVLIEKMKEEK